MAKSAKKPFKSKWWKPVWLHASWRKETPTLRETFTEPVTYSIGGTVEYRRVKGVWQAHRIELQKAA